MKARRFGVEIEVQNITREKIAETVVAVLRARGLETTLGTANGYPVIGSPMGTWKVVPDGSIGFGGELVTPPLRYEHIEALQEILRALKAAGAKVSQATGLHVHVDAAGLQAADLGALVKMTYAKEDLLAATLRIPQARRMRYCRELDNERMARIVKARTMTALKKAWYNERDIRTADYRGAQKYDQTRYHGLNLHAVWFHGTVEFRVFNGTLHAGELKANIQLALAMVQTATEVHGFQTHRARVADLRHQFRVFLWRTLGLGGEEFKTLRHHLSKNLPTGAQAPAAA